MVILVRKGNPRKIRDWADLARPNQFGGQFDLVYPIQSIVAVFPVAVVGKVVDKNGLRKQATAYLHFLYWPTGQTIAARHFPRPARRRRSVSLPGHTSP